MSDTQYILKQIHEIKHLIGALETRVGRLEKWQKPFNKDPRNPKNTVPHDGITATHTKADEWLSTEDIHPDVLEVRVRLSDGSELNCWAQTDGDFYWKGGGTEMFIPEHYVTHWMPLPDPPKQEQSHD